ncbi:hypothetical protein BV372_33980 [Nostoc sp. T09]|uniref:hypothetical protein n=1 Tax=Nostoc sp. T09 TaxID=1932621 RepID=UPI000A381778|nr:hypothetical protein [Nostoc sp. T09]OUL18760.1 hypothetical protein BV372_33980 [Nostoc sp. T09]
MEIFFTIISGATVFILGQLALKLLIEPIQEFRKTIADIAYALIEYANIYANPGVAGNEVEKQASKELRKLSSRLNAQIYLIPLYALTSQVFRLPSTDKLVGAATDLIGLSNGVFKSPTDLVFTNMDRAKRIRTTLGIYIQESKQISTTSDEMSN